LVLDLNGDGTQTLPIRDGVYFDHNINLFAEKTGWINPSDAFLVIDINNNGIIDNSSDVEEETHVPSVAKTDLLGKG
jgi:hypothetical protein